MRRESAEAKVEPIVAEEFGRLGWQAGEPPGWTKSDPGKLATAARLRQETTLPLKEIAGRVHLRTSRSANARLHQCTRQPVPTDLPKPAWSYESG